MMHRAENIFPGPDNFDPERWMDPTASRRLEKYLVPFSRGPRQCIGMPYVLIHVRPCFLSNVDSVLRTVRYTSL